MVDGRLKGCGWTGMKGWRLWIAYGLKELSDDTKKSLLSV